MISKFFFVIIWWLLWKFSQKPLWVIHTRFIFKKIHNAKVSPKKNKPLIKTQGTRTWQIDSQRHEGLMTKDMKVWGFEIWRLKDIKTLKVCSEFCFYVGLTFVEEKFVSWEVRCVEPPGHWWKFPKNIKSQQS